MLNYRNFDYLIFNALHKATQYYTTLHNTLLYYTTLHCTTQHYTALHNTTKHCEKLHYTKFNYTSLKLKTVECALHSALL